MPPVTQCYCLRTYEQRTTLSILKSIHKYFWIHKWLTGCLEWQERVVCFSAFFLFFTSPPNADKLRHLTRYGTYNWFSSTDTYDIIYCLETYIKKNYSRYIRNIKWNISYICLISWMSIVSTLTSPRLLLSDNGLSLDCLTLTNSLKCCSQTEPNLIIWFFILWTVSKKLTRQPASSYPNQLSAILCLCDFVCSYSTPSRQLVCTPA